MHLEHNKWCLWYGSQNRRDMKRIPETYNSNTSDNISQNGFWKDEITAIV
jgi:hypothetical protein